MTTIKNEQLLKIWRKNLRNSQNDTKNKNSGVKKTPVDRLKINYWLHDHTYNSGLIPAISWGDLPGIPNSP